MNPIGQPFFNELAKKLGTAADKLRHARDAAVLHYVSDGFAERQPELREQFQNPDHDCYTDPVDSTDDCAGNLTAKLEVHNYHTEKNVFRVSMEARWHTLRDCAQLPPGAALPWQVHQRSSRQVVFE